MWIHVWATKNHRHTGLSINARSSTMTIEVTNSTFTARGYLFDHLPFIPHCSLLIALKVFQKPCCCAVLPRKIIQHCSTYNSSQGKDTFATLSNLSVHSVHAGSCFVQQSFPGCFIPICTRPLTWMLDITRSHPR